MGTKRLARKKGAPRALRTPTFARNFRASCRALSSFVKACARNLSMSMAKTHGEGKERLTRSCCTAFMLDLTMTRVSRSSLSILASNDLRISGFTNIIPLGETVDRDDQ